MFEDTITKSDLLFRIKNLTDTVKGYESGEKYVQMKKECEAIHRADLRALEKRGLSVMRQGQRPAMLVISGTKLPWT